MFWIGIGVLKVIPVGWKLLFAHFLHIKQQGLIFQEPRIDLISNKDQSPKNQRSIPKPPGKKNCFKFVLTSSKAWYKNHFLLCFIIYLDSNMLLYINNTNLFWFGSYTCEIIIFGKGCYKKLGHILNFCNIRLKLMSKIVAFLYEWFWYLIS